MKSRILTMIHAKIVSADSPQARERAWAQIQNDGMGLPGWLLEARNQEYAIAVDDIREVVRTLEGYRPLDRERELRQEAQINITLAAMILNDIHLAFPNRAGFRARTRIVLTGARFLLGALAPGNYAGCNDEERISILRDIHDRFCKSAIENSTLPISSKQMGEIVRRIDRIQAARLPEEKNPPPGRSE